MGSSQNTCRRVCTEYCQIDWACVHGCVRGSEFLPRVLGINSALPPIARPRQPRAHGERLSESAVAVPKSPGRSLEKDAVRGLQFRAIFACLSGQRQPILWAACACLKVFGFDNLISASPFLASLSTC